jgi:hypothetical protein
LGPTEHVLPEHGDRIQSPKRVLKKTGQFLDKDRTMVDVQKHNIFTNVPSSQTIRSYLQRSMEVNSPTDLFGELRKLNIISS